MTQLQEMGIVGLVIKAVLIIGSLALVGLILKSAFFTVSQQTVAIIERFGKFIRIQNAGLGFKIPLIDRVVGRPSLQTQELTISIETKTDDNVFVTLKITVMYSVLQGKVYEAWYLLQNPRNQISSYIYDVVRSQVPNRKLDEVFEDKEAIASAVKEKLAQVMEGFGYLIANTLVTDIDPDAKVKASMNEINAATRLRAAAQEKGEADKTLAVKKAEAEKEAKKLQGEGIAAQRKAIAEGFRESVDMLKESTGTDGAEVMRMLMVTQHYDMLNNATSAGNSTIIMLPYSPDSISGVNNQLMEAMLVSGKVNEKKTKE